VPEILRQQGKCVHGLAQPNILHKPTYMHEPFGMRQPNLEQEDFSSTCSQHNALYIPKGRDAVGKNLSFDKRVMMVW